MKIKLSISAITIAMMLGCAQKAENVQGTYISSKLYENLSCQQLVQEGWTVSNRAHTLAGLQNRHRIEDEAAITVGAIIFWPALFFTHGNDSTTAELAQLKGEMEAIEIASQVNHCNLDFQRV